MKNEKKFIVTKSQLKRIVQKSALSDILNKKNELINDKIKKLKAELEVLESLPKPDSLTVDSSQIEGSVMMYIKDDEGKIIIGNESFRSLWKEVIPLIDKSLAPKYYMGYHTLEFNKKPKKAIKKIALSSTPSDIAKYINSLFQ